MMITKIYLSKVTKVICESEFSSSSQVISEISLGESISYIPELQETAILHNFRGFRTKHKLELVCENLYCVCHSLVSNRKY